MRYRLTIALIAVMLAAGCMRYTTHQGNVLKEDAVWLVQEGDSQFRVETLLGSPAMTDALHPNRVRYIEDYDNPDTGEKYVRGIEITYDEALRVRDIRRFGFDK